MIGLFAVYKSYSVSTHCSVDVRGLLGLGIMVISSDMEFVMVLVVMVMMTMVVVQSQKRAICSK